MIPGQLLQFPTRRLFSQHASPAARRDASRRPPTRNRLSCCRFPLTIFEGGNVVTVPVLVCPGIGRNCRQDCRADSAARSGAKAPASMAGSHICSRTRRRGEQRTILRRTEHRARPQAAIEKFHPPLEGGSKNSEARAEEFFGAGCCVNNTPPRNSLFAAAQR